MPALSQRTATPDQTRAAHQRASDQGLTLATGSVTDRSGLTQDTLVAPANAEMSANPAFEEDARRFESALGVDAYARALPAAEGLCLKAKDYFVAKYGAWEQTNAALEPALTSLGSDNAGWSGTVGTAMADIMAVFDSGNVATRMNHLGNFFTNILGSDLLEDDPAMDIWLSHANMDMDQINARRASQTGNAWTTMVKTPSTSEVAGQGVTRVDAGAPQRTENSVASSGVTLDPAEAAVQQRATEAEGGTWDPQNSVLHWEEGARKWAMNENNAWVAKMRELSMPLGAGPSGTTNMLMNAAQVLGGAKPEDTRLACIGYLVPANHHSLVEIMEAAAPFGAGYTDGQQMYTNIAPYNDGQLRDFGGGKFPHERHPSGTT